MKTKCECPICIESYGKEGCPKTDTSLFDRAEQLLFLCSYCKTQGDKSVEKPNDSTVEPTKH